jgi:hypothetical protein
MEVSMRNTFTMHVEYLNTGRVFPVVVSGNTPYDVGSAVAKLGLYFGDEICLYSDKSNKMVAKLLNLKELEQWLDMDAF